MRWRIAPGGRPGRRGWPGRMGPVLGAGSFGEPPRCLAQAAALHLALRLARPQATVVDLAFYQGGAAELRLGAEFHHNGLGVRCAQIGRVPRGLSHSWDRERLSAETINLLRADGAAIRKHLVTAMIPFEDAPEFLANLATARLARTANRPHLWAFDGRAALGPVSTQHTCSHRGGQGFKTPQLHPGFRSPSHRPGAATISARHANCKAPSSGAPV